MKKIEIGDVLRCITDEEPPFNNLKVGDEVAVITINSYNDVLIEFDGHRDWCRIGDLYLNFENLNKTTEGEEVPEDVQFSHMVKALAKSGEAIKAEMTAQNANLLHMVIGISGESGELLSGVVGKEDIKVCRDCKETKVIADYYSDSSKRDGHATICKACDLRIKRDFGRTKKGLIQKMYRNQISSSEKRGHGVIGYSREQLSCWLMENDNFHKLFDEWADSGFIKDKTPSIDRIDNSIGYSFDNIQLMTWLENKEKGHKDSMTERLSTGIPKRPVAIFKDGEFLSVTLSVREADRLTGVHNGNIPRMIKEGGVSKKGFSFKYVDEAEADQSVRKDIAINITICASQLLDAVKKAVIYQKPLDIVNVIEELGDLEFYMEGLRQELRITREETLQATIDKLAVRYKGLKYSDTSAQERADKA